MVSSFSHLQTIKMASLRDPEFPCVHSSASALLLHMVLFDHSLCKCVANGPPFLIRILNLSYSRKRNNIFSRFDIFLQKPDTPLNSESFQSILMFFLTVMPSVNNNLYLLF